MFSRRLVPGTPDYARIAARDLDRNNLGNAIPGATPRAQIDIASTSWLARIAGAPLKAKAGQPLEIRTRVTNLSARPSSQESYGRRMVRLGAQLCAQDGTLINRDYERRGCPRTCKRRHGGDSETVTAPETQDATAQVRHGERRQRLVREVGIANPVKDLVVG